MNLLLLLAFVEWAWAFSSRSTPAHNQTIKASQDALVVDRPGFSGVTWSGAESPWMATELSTHLDPSIRGFGTTIKEHSKELVSDRSYIMSALILVEHIYDTNSNYTEPVQNYELKHRVQRPWFAQFNISAVGRGNEEGLPITFNNGAMVLFIRWLAQTSDRNRTYRWATFDCVFNWQQPGGEQQRFVVAEGNFTSSAPPPPRTPPSTLTTLDLENS